MGEVIMGGPEKKEYDYSSDVESMIGEPINIDEMLERFTGAAFINDPAGLVPYFQSHLSDESICIEIPIFYGGVSVEDRLTEIGKNLRNAIWLYSGRDQSEEIREDIKSITGEAVADIRNHSLPNSQLNKIFVKVHKNNERIEILLANPAKDSVDLSHIDGADSKDEHSPESHGKPIAKRLEADLNRLGCATEDKSQDVTGNENRKVGVMRDITIKLPVIETTESQT